MSCCTKFWITYQEIISQTCVVMYIYYIQTFKDRSNSYCKRKKIHVPITYLFFLSQWAFKPHKMSLWDRGSTWLLSSFRYTFKHYFSYRIGPYLSFVFLMCTETFQIFSLVHSHRNSWLTEGWTVLTETIALFYHKRLRWQTSFRCCNQNCMEIVFEVGKYFRTHKSELWK